MQASCILSMAFFVACAVHVSLGWDEFRLLETGLLHTERPVV